MDIVGLFVQDACVPDPKAVTPSKTLYEAFRDWCAENGHELLTPKQFGRRLSAKGFTCGRARVEGKLCRCWFGLRLRNENDPQPDLLQPSEPTDEPVTLVTLVTLRAETSPIKGDTAEVFDQCVTDVTNVTPQPVNTPSDIGVDPEKSERNLQQSEKFVDTEQWLEELCAELSEASNKPPDDTSSASQQKLDRLACLCGGELRLFGKTYECLRCDSPRIAACRYCGKVLQLTSDSHAECVGCGLLYTFDRARRLWLSDLDAF